MAIASRVVSVSPRRHGPVPQAALSDKTDEVFCRQRPDATLRSRALRHLSTVASRAAGLKGFGRLEIAPELDRHGQEIRLRVRFRDQRPAGDHDDGNGRPLPLNVPHGLKPIHARHEDVEEQEIEVSAFERS